MTVGLPEELTNPYMGTTTTFAILAVMRPYGPRKEPQHDLAVNTLTYNMDDGMYCRIAARRRNLYWLTHESGLPDDATVLHMPSIT